MSRGYAARMKEFFKAPAGLVLLALLAVGGTAATLIGIPDLQVDNDVRTMIPSDHPVLK